MSNSEFSVYLYVRTKPDKHLTEAEEDEIMERVVSALGCYFEVVPAPDYALSGSIAIEADLHGKALDVERAS